MCESLRHESVPPAATSHPTSPARRQLLIDATRELLRREVRHSVSIGDIRAAAGITGPGVYRHFNDKDDLLVVVLQDAADQLWRGIPEDNCVTPFQLLDAYVESPINSVVDNAELLEVWYQESRHLPEPARSAQRRLQRA